MNSKIKIMVCCHKKTNVCEDDIYLPIQVGHAISNCELDMQKDDQLCGNKCDNISELNGIYCEMTAMYWAWKNIRKVYPDIEYVGLCHYRRYFFVSKNKVKDYLKYFTLKLKAIVKTFLNKPFGFMVHDPVYNAFDVTDKRLQRSNKELQGLVEGYDLVATKPCKLINTTVEDFFKIIGQDYINLMTEIIDSRFSKYKESYHNIISGNRISVANMLIFKTDLLDEYSSFVFNVLEEHINLTKEKGLCDNPKKEKIYSRVSGYLAEVLTCTYIDYCKDKYKLKTIDKCFIENP